MAALEKERRTRNGFLRPDGREHAYGIQKKMDQGHTVRTRNDRRGRTQKSVTHQQERTGKVRQKGARNVET